jgi:anti-sigma regulatory factor (Ser/Thr protein kinase)
MIPCMAIGVSFTRHIRSRQRQSKSKTQRIRKSRAAFSESNVNAVSHTGACHNSCYSSVHASSFDAVFAVVLVY